MAPKIVMGRRNLQKYYRFLGAQVVPGRDGMSGMTGWLGDPDSNFDSHSAPPLEFALIADKSFNKAPSRQQTLACKPGGGRPELRGLDAVVETSIGDTFQYDVADNANLRPKEFLTVVYLVDPMRMKSLVQSCLQGRRVGSPDDSVDIEGKGHRSITKFTDPFHRLQPPGHANFEDGLAE